MTAKELEHVVHAYYEDVLRYFVYRVRDRVLAEDLTQETFYRLLRYSSNGVSFASEKKCKAYLFTVASNVQKDWYAKNTPHDALDESIPAQNGESELPLVIESAVAKLPDVQREAVVLYYYSGFRIREIAKIQGVTVSAVKSRLKTARDTLRTILSKEGFV